LEQALFIAIYSPGGYSFHYNRTSTGLPIAKLFGITSQSKASITTPASFEKIWRNLPDIFTKLNPPA